MLSVTEVTNVEMVLLLHHVMRCFYRNHSVTFWFQVSEGRVLKRSPSPPLEKPLLILPANGQNGTRPGLVHQLALQNGVKRFAVDMDATDHIEAHEEDDRPIRWPGLEGIVEAYQKYAQGERER